MRKTSLRESIEDLSFGILSTAINLTVTLATTWEAILTSSTNPRDVSRALENLSKTTGVHKDSLKRAFWKAKNKGLLERKREGNRQYWAATEAGKKRLEEEVPTYQKERPWDKRLYLVTYDIPEEYHNLRNKLREILLKIGARRFQDSVYLILWDPTDALKTFTKENNFAGSVVVSDTGSDGSIGEKNLHELIWKVFELESLNSRYQEFLNRSINNQPLRLAFHYLSILKDDPQLPFELLGPTWLGNKAYRKYKSLTENNKPLLKSNPPG